MLPGYRANNATPVTETLGSNPSEEAKARILATVETAKQRHFLGYINAARSQRHPDLSRNSYWKNWCWFACYFGQKPSRDAAKTWNEATSRDPAKTWNEATCSWPLLCPSDKVSSSKLDELQAQQSRRPFVNAHVSWSLEYLQTHANRIRDKPI